MSEGKPTLEERLIRGFMRIAAAIIIATEQYRKDVDPKP